MKWENPSITLFGLAVDCTRLYDKALPKDEARLRTIFDRLVAHGPVLILVDQPNTIGALPVTVARSCGHRVAYLPGLSMRRIADLYPGQAKTDARDAFIIADTPITCRTRCGGSTQAMTHSPSWVF